jgi:hypothetical protein
MWTDLHAPYDFTPAYIRRKRNGEWQVPPRALIRIEGWTTFDHRYLPIGGFLADSKGNRKVEIEFGVDVADDRVLITGCLKPAVADVPITAEITDEGGKWMYLYAATDQRGCFDKSKHEEASLPPADTSFRYL